MIALNAVIYNEASRIVECLSRASAYCDELVVVDQGSTDGSAELAWDFGAKVYQDIHWGYCEPSRPLAAEHTKSDWIICLDADEQVAPQYVGIMKFIPLQWLGARFNVASYVDGVRIDPVIYSRDPARNGRYHPNPQLRFFKRGMVTYGLGLHTRIEPNFPEEQLLTPPDEGWILNIKSQAEWDADDLRYQDLENAQ